MTSWLISAVIGIIAGWLAGKISKNHGFGIGGDLIVGLVGAVIGRSLLSLVGFEAYGFIGSLIAATFGALVLLWLIRLISPAAPAYKK